MPNENLRNELIDELKVKFPLGNPSPLDISNFILERDKKIVEKCAKVADHQTTICGRSLSRISTCHDIAYNIRNMEVKNVKSQ